jgi:hypothetical protein
LIIVTPRIVSQADFDSAKTRTVAGAEPSAADLLLLGQSLDKPLARDLRGTIDPTPPPPALRGAITPPVPASSVPTSGK